MNFKELKNGYQVYILDRANMKSDTGKVCGVTLPHVDAKIGGPTGLVVDLDVDTANGRKSFCMLADTDTAYQGNIVISTGRERIAQEVEAIKTQAEAALAQVEQNKATLNACNDLLAKLDPSIKEKLQNEQRLANLEGSLERLAGMIEKIITNKAQAEE